MNKRIETIASLINDAKTILDIGCDHGYLILEALKKNPDLVCHAIEVNEGPLLNAKRNLGMFKNVSFHLSNGLLDFNEDFDFAVISGMGGELTRKILEDSKEKFKGKTLILGPQSDNVVVRKWLYDNDFKIVKELNLVENNKYYEIIKAVGNSKDTTNYLELLFGKYLYYEANLEYLNHYHKLLNNKLKGLKNDNLDILEDVISLKFAVKEYKNNYYEYSDNIYIDELFIGNKKLVVLLTDDINYSENIAFKLIARGYDCLVVNYLEDENLNLEEIINKYNYDSYEVISFKIKRENVTYFANLEMFLAYFK